MKKTDIYPFLSKGSAFFLEPIQDKGLLLKVLYTDKTSSVFSTASQSFLSQIVQFFGYDLIALRKQYGQAIGKRQMIPLPLLVDWILVPLKLSTTPNGEFFTGWVVVQSIVGIEAETHAVTKLRLEGDHVVYCGHRKSFCDQQLRHVNLVQHRYERLHNKENLVKEVRLSYSK